MNRRIRVDSNSFDCGIVIEVLLTAYSGRGGVFLLCMSIPEQSGHPFHGKADSDSIPFRTPIPFESGQ